MESYPPSRKPEDVLVTVMPEVELEKLLNDASTWFENFNSQQTYWHTESFLFGCFLDHLKRF